MELDRRDGAFVQHLLHVILLQIDHQNEDIRACVLKCANQFLMIRSNAIFSNFDEFMKMIYKCTNDPSTKVKRYVCQSLNHVTELQPDALVPVLESVIGFMLQYSQDEDPDLALEAADFWLIVCDQEALHVHIQPYMPRYNPHLIRIIPIILKSMIYSDDDIFMLETIAEQHNAHVADQDQDIKPRFHKNKTHELVGEKETEQKHDEDDESDLDDFDDDEYEEEWNLRKCSAAALDNLSTVFGDDILNDLLPTVNQMLIHSEWKTQEAGILAIGAIAQGCATGMQPHLPALLPHLLELLKHEKALIRSITCWTLGRYAFWIAAPPPPISETPEALHQHIQTYMLPMLQAVLQLCLDSNKDVQKSGCSAMATLFEEAGDTLIPYLPPIIDTMAAAFGIYQKKNLLVLYDSFGTLAEGVGSALNQPQYIQKFMPPLINKWQSIPDDDYDLFPLLEVFRLN